LFEEGVQHVQGLDKIQSKLKNKEWISSCGGCFKLIIFALFLGYKQAI